MDQLETSIIAIKHVHCSCIGNNVKCIVFVTDLWLNCACVYLSNCCMCLPKQHSQLTTHNSTCMHDLQHLGDGLEELQVSYKSIRPLDIVVVAETYCQSTTCQHNLGNNRPILHFRIIGTTFSITKVIQSMRYGLSIRNAHRIAIVYGHL